MTPNEKYIESTKTGDVNLLREAIAEGADINLEVRPNDETYFEQMVYDWGCGESWYKENPDTEPGPPFPEDQLLEYTRVLVENGFNVDHCVDEDNDPLDVFWHVAKWSGSLRLLEYLLQNGMNPNGPKRYGGSSPLDELEGDIFMEECCGYPNYADQIY